VNRRTVPGLLAVVGVLALSPALAAYLKLGSTVADRLVQLRWAHLPIRYFVSNHDVVGVSAPQLRVAVGAAFSAWARVPSASLSSEFVGFTDAEPFQDDNVTVIGFQAHPELDRVLGSTTFTVDTGTGELLESDIFLNSTMQWSVAPNGETARHDVQSILVHEIGHLLGLGHSALGETALDAAGKRSVLGKRAVMFPIAYPPGNTEDRTLEADDVAAIGDVYPAARLAPGRRRVSGRQRRSRPER